MTCIMIHNKIINRRWVGYNPKEMIYSSHKDKHGNLYLSLNNNSKLEGEFITCFCN